MHTNTYVHVYTCTFTCHAYIHQEKQTYVYTVANRLDFGNSPALTSGIEEVPHMREQREDMLGFHAGFLARIWQSMSTFEESDTKKTA